MLKKSFLCCLTLLASSIVNAADAQEDCESAVEAADRLNASATSDCDYSNIGLNGVLHRAIKNTENASIKKNEEDAALNNAKKVEENTHTKTTTHLSKERESLLYIAAAEFSTPQELLTVRYELIQKAVRECSKGIELINERYKSTETHDLTLELNYSCL